MGESYSDDESAPTGARHTHRNLCPSELAAVDTVATTPESTTIKIAPTSLGPGLPHGGSTSSPCATLDPTGNQGVVLAKLKVVEKQYPGQAFAQRLKTIGRAKQSSIPLSQRNLQSLAPIFRDTPADITQHPDFKAMSSQRDRDREILRKTAAKVDAAIAQCDAEKARNAASREENAALHLVNQELSQKLAELQLQLARPVPTLDSASMPSVQAHFGPHLSIAETPVWKNHSKRTRITTPSNIASPPKVNNLAARVHNSYSELATDHSSSNSSMSDDTTLETVAFDSEQLVQVPTVLELANSMVKHPQQGAAVSPPAMLPPLFSTATPATEKCSVSTLPQLAVPNSVPSSLMRASAAPSIALGISSGAEGPRLALSPTECNQSKAAPKLPTPVSSLALAMTKGQLDKPAEALVAAIVDMDTTMQTIQSSADAPNTTSPSAVSQNVSLGKAKSSLRLAMVASQSSGLEHSGPMVESAEAELIPPEPRSASNAPALLLEPIQIESLALQPNDGPNILELSVLKPSVMRQDGVLDRQRRDRLDGGLDLVAERGELRIHHDDAVGADRDRDVAALAFQPVGLVAEIGGLDFDLVPVDLLLRIRSSYE